MGSAGMDAAGNIGLAFNIASATLPVGISYTGRFDGDPLGEMTVGETEIVAGVGVQTFTNRFGDYSHLTMDPDNFTFWHTAEYFSSNNSWRTQIAAFSLSGGFANDTGISNILQPNNGILTASENVEVSIRNYGSLPQSNIPMELRVDGNLIASENYVGVIAPNTTENYVFTQTIDLSNAGQTYEVKVRTNLVGDEFPANDSFTKDVTHLLANDIGVLEISAPQSESGLGTETISVTIKNFGANPQSNFNVQYAVDGSAPVVENFAGTIVPEDEVTFNFNQTYDFSEIGTYSITASTSLSGDMNPSNDSVTEEVQNLLCQPSLNCSFGDGLQLFSVAEINNPSGCEGYGDFTNLTAVLEPGNTYDLTVTTGYGDQFLSVWIDYNDDSIFTSNELVVTNYEIANGQDQGTYTVTIDLVVPPSATLGAHRMRAKTNYDAPVPTDSCAITEYGETEDYTANIGTLGVDDYSIKDSELIITHLEENEFEITLRSSYDGIAYVAVYNMLGQQLGIKTLSKNGDAYKVRLNMEEASSGVYILKVGGKNTTSFKTGRIIVK